MAVSTSTIFSNNTPAEAALVSDSHFDMHSTPKYAIGTQKTMSDGRMFRYSHFAEDTGVGKLVAQDFSGSGIADTDNSILAPASCVNTDDCKIGSKYVEMTVASVEIVDQYAGGYLHTTDDTGQGYTYRIKGSTVTGDPATGTIRLELFDALQVALDATTDFSITGCPWANLLGATAATDSIIAGVTVGAVDVSEAAYGWVQVKGVGTVLADGTIALGDVLTLSDGVTGGVQTMDAYTEPLVGYAIDAPDTTGYVPVMLNLV